MTKQIVWSDDLANIINAPFEFRHTPECQKKFGVWRWQGMYDNRERIISSLDGAVIDFGGALAPLGFGSVIIDKEKRNIFGVQVDYNSIEKFPIYVDTIFSSHTLEHINSLDYILDQIYKKLKIFGHLILHLPDISGAKFWHPDVKKEHHRIFSLSKNVSSLQKVCYIDKKLEKQYKIIFAEVVRDQSILLIAQKKVR